jgi:dTDP-4-amino-4,6-dideoxygalactose transaminase
MGDVGCFSMYVAHLLVAGVGGIATTNNPDLAMRMRSLVNHGMSLDQLNMDENFSPMPAVGRRFKFESLGHSFRITEFEAAIALAQLSTWKEMIRRRRINAQHLTARLFDLQDVITPVISGENTHSWMMYPILLRQYTNGATQSKTEIMAYLNAHGIQTRDMPSCLGQPIYPELVPEDFPMSNWINHSGFYVGCHQDLTIEHMDFVANRIKEFYGRG